MEISIKILFTVYSLKSILMDIKVYALLNKVGYIVNTVVVLKVLFYHPNTY